MSWGERLRPRHPVLAARFLLGVVGVAGLVQLVQTATTPVHGGLRGLVASYAVPVLLILVGAALVRFAEQVPAALWTAVPATGVLAIVYLDVTSRDASVLGQVFLVFPVLFAASQLPRLPALAITALTAAGEAAVTFSVEDTGQAATDTAVMTAALVTTCLLLLHANAEQERLVGRLADLAAHDPLTGLLSRRPLDELADRALHTGRGRGTALLLVDLDLFKQVNDSYGHPVGDDFLVHVARFLEQRCRASDAVTRLGGDEFAVLLQDCGPEAARERAETLLADAAQHPFPFAAGEIPLRFTVGVGHLPAEAGGSVRELYALADAALYTAKRDGRGRVA